MDDFDNSYILETLRTLPEEVLGELSGPFLTAPLEGLRADRPTYLYVGQETYGWGSAADYVATENGAARAMRDYQLFDLASGKHGWGCRTKTPFWSVHRTLAARLGVPYQNLVWSNLVRFDGAQKEKTRASLIRRGHLALSTLITAQRGMLAHEIEQYCVRGIVFVTGPHYDWVLGRRLRTDGMEPVIEALPACVLAKVKLADFLGIAAFRTYHPRYLRQKKLERQVIDAIVPALASGT